jgi:hypothetical protein
MLYDAGSRIGPECVLCHGWNTDGRKTKRLNSTLVRPKLINRPTFTPVALKAADKTWKPERRGRKIGRETPIFLEFDPVLSVALINLEGRAEDCLADVFVFKLHRHHPCFIGVPSVAKPSGYPKTAPCAGPICSHSAPTPAFCQPRAVCRGGARQTIWGRVSTAFP